MAFSSITSLAFSSLPAAITPHSRYSKSQPFFSGTSLCPSLFLSKPSKKRFPVAFSRRRNNSSSAKTSSKNKKLVENDDEDRDGFDEEDPIEALFIQLEKDLKNDPSLDDDDDGPELTEEELARLEQELAYAVGDGDDDEVLGISSLNSSNIGSDDDGEEEKPLKLKNWQLRRLAIALKIGRWKTSIKSLAAELGLDRAVVLELLCDPPPNLLLMCASLPDTVASPKPVETENVPIDTSLTSADDTESLPEKKVPVQVTHGRWSAKKQLKKVQVETLERVNSRTKRSTKLVENDDEDKDGFDEEDAIEALFTQLEEDLKNDPSLDDDDAGSELTEEELARLEQELAYALGDGDDDEVLGISGLNASNIGSDDDGEEEEKPLKLKNWQLRRLAVALKVGRRKTSIKSLAAELGLDRAVVLELLRDPPPNLLLMCASLPDTVALPKPVETETVPIDTSLTTADDTESLPKKKVPVHVMHGRWSAKKRLKKVQIETLERVYSRTKRPTNAMISSIVHLTNLPWKSVVKWFEEKRLQDGVPDQRFPFRRVEEETLSQN